MDFNGFQQTILKSELRFSRIDTFNDPLDCSPYLSFKNWWEPFDNNYKLIHSIKNSFFRRFIEPSYVCCFCQEYDTDNSFLMWSHYAKNHSGVCFEIDFEKTKFMGGPSKVTYSQNIQKDRQKISQKTSEERGLFLATTKIKQWSYEKEVRLIVDLESPSLNSKMRLEENKMYLYYPFDLSLISKIIFGVNASENDTSGIISLLNSKQITPKYEKIIINPNTVQMETINYDDY